MGTQSKVPWPKVRRENRPRCETPLSRYCVTHRITIYEVAKRIGVSYPAAAGIFRGQTMPSLVTAFKIEAEFGVPVASWLGTEIGRFQWELRYDWGQWMDYKADEEKRNGKPRRAKYYLNKKAKDSREKIDRVLSPVFGEDDGDEGTTAPVESDPEDGA